VRFFSAISALWGAGLVSVASAGDIDFTPEIEISGIAYESRTISPQFFEGDVNALAISPSLLATYQGSNVNAAFSANYFFNEQDTDEGRISNNFTEYNYLIDTTLIDNYLTANFNGSLTFENTDPTQTLVNDFFIGFDDLTKVRFNTGEVEFELPSPKYIGINWLGRFSVVESDQSTNSFNNLDNESYRYLFEVVQGSQFQRVSWNFAVDFQDTTGRGQQSDIQSRTASADVRFALFSNLRLVLVSSVEDNQLESEGLLSDDLSLDTYGAGLSWHLSNNRNVAVTFNRANSSNDESDRDFLGLDVNWAFSSRTNLTANYSRRFFGETGSADFSYNTRRFRAVFSYFEELTNFSRLLSNQVDLGVFVCPINDQSLTSCFQPDSLAFNLSPEQVFTGFFQQVPEISEEIILQKRGTLDLGYQKKKFSASLSGNVSNTDFLETDRSQENNSLRFNASYQIGLKTSLDTSLNFTRTLFVEDDVVDAVQSSTFGVTRTFSPRFESSIEFRFIDRESDIDLRDLQDRRISINFNYRL
jgi:uncharacterized protein (PEP-CTERM system associated)